jgi:hypothetical protein
MIRKFLCLTMLLAAPAHAAGWRDTVTALSDTLKHPAWGASHSRRDYTLAKAMAKADGVMLDDDVLFAASYLHDMGAFARWNETHKDHSEASADKVDAVLAGTDFPADKLEAVRAAIRTHMYNRDPAAPEARYLHDADALDWLGAIGVARQFGMVDPKGGFPTGPDAVKAIQGLMDKVPSHVVTPAGKARLSSLLTEDKAFLDALAQESRDFGDL